MPFKGKAESHHVRNSPGAPRGDCDLISGLVGTLMYSNYQRAKVHMGEGEHLVGPGNYIKPDNHKAHTSVGETPYSICLQTDHKEIYLRGFWVGKCLPSEKS